jgi:hypothetical protein
VKSKEKSGRSRELLYGIEVFQKRSDADHMRPTGIGFSEGNAGIFLKAENTPSIAPFSVLECFTRVPRRFSI